MIVSQMPIAVYKNKERRIYDKTERDGKDCF